MISKTNLNKDKSIYALKNKRIFVKDRYEALAEAWNVEKAMWYGISGE